jgi:hypothetical protein
MTANNMKPQGRRRRRTGTPSLRGLQGRSATGQNGQAAKEELSAIWGAGCRKNNSGVPAGRSVFHLTSPFIGLSHSSGGGYVRNRPRPKHRMIPCAENGGRSLRQVVDNPPKLRVRRHEMSSSSRSFHRALEVWKNQPHVLWTWDRYYLCNFSSNIIDVAASCTRGN